MHEDIYICVDGFSFALKYLYCPLAMEINLKVSASYDKIRIVFLLFWYIIFIVPFHTLYFCKMLIQFPMDDVKSTVRVSLSNYKCIAVFLQCKIRWCCCAHQSFLHFQLAPGGWQKSNSQSNSCIKMARLSQPYSWIGLLTEYPWRGLGLLQANVCGSFILYEFQ